MRALAVPRSLLLLAACATPSPLREVTVVGHASFAGRAGLGAERADQSTMMWVSKIIQEQVDSSGLFGRAMSGWANAQAKVAATSFVGPCAATCLSGRNSVVATLR